MLLLYDQSIEDINIKGAKVIAVEGGIEVDLSQCTEHEKYLIKNIYWPNALKRR